MKDISECYIREEAEDVEVKLEMIIVSEKIGPKFIPNKVISTGSCDDDQPAVEYPQPMSAAASVQMRDTMPVSLNN